MELLSFSDLHRIATIRCAWWSAHVLHGQALDLSEDEAAAKLESCREDAVLVVHSPPKGCLDEVHGRHLAAGRSQMVDSVRLGAVVDECMAVAFELVVEGDRGGEAAEACEDAFFEAGEGACAVAFEGEGGLCRSRRSIRSAGAWARDAAGFRVSACGTGA
jgi:hypothetical protein